MKGEGVKYKIIDEKIDGDTAEVIISQKLDKGAEAMTQKFELVKEDGSWKVSKM